MTGGQAPTTQVRVHGIGGPTAASVLGMPEEAGTQVVWQKDTRAASGLRAGTARGIVAYHWAPLTSGSRWFALWPLLLPFTILNVAGWMHPRGAVRGGLSRLLVHLICLVTTASAVGWITLAGQILAARWDRAEVEGVVGSVALVALVVVVALWTRPGFETTRVTGLRSEESWWAGARAPSLTQADVFGRGWRWPSIGVHLLAIAVPLAHVAREAGRGSVGESAEQIVVVTGALQLGLLALLGVVSVRRAGAWSLAAFGAAATGVALVGGLLAGALLTIVGTCPTTPVEPGATEPDGCSAFTGDAFIAVDLYGMAVLVALAVGLALVVRRLRRAAPAEEAATTAGLLPGIAARLRGRVAVLAPALAGALGVAALVFALAAAVLFPARAPDRAARWCDQVTPFSADEAPCDSLSGAWCDDLPGLAADDWPCSELPTVDDEWRLTDTPLVGVARLTFLALIVAMGVNLVRSRASFDQLRRVGNVWDVLTFWPRAFHPFAVRSYGERAVPELQQVFLRDPVSGPPGPLDLRAHSQGSVLVLAALAGLGDRPTRVRSLLTFGSPIRSLYQQAFPAQVDPDLVETVRSRVPWCNAFRLTDHVGRAVFCDDADWRDGDPDDVGLVDPPEPGAGIAGHSGYWRDEVTLDRLAAARIPGASPAHPTPHAEDEP